MTEPDDGAADAARRDLAVLWGRSAPRRRGPRGTLTVDKIADAAIALADREGLPAVSMQRVAAELGFTTMALYNHIRGKDLLLEVMMDVAAGEPPDLSGEPDWRAAVTHWSRSLWTSFTAHPWVLAIPVGSGPRGPRQLAWFERLLAQLLSAGLAPQDARHAGLYLLTSIRGLAQVALDLTPPSGQAQNDAAAAQVLAHVAEADRFPALAEVMARQGTPSHEPASADGDVLHTSLAFGLERLLDGIGAWVGRPRD